MQAQVEALPSQQLVSLTGLFLITEDGLSVASHVAAALQQKGATTAILNSSTLAEPEKLEQAIAQLRQLHGSVTGIIHLAPLAALELPETLAGWRQITQIHCKSLFQLLHLCAADLQQAGQQQMGCVVAASLLGGYFGRQGQGISGLPSAGSNTGFLKTLVTEWPGVRAKAIDFDNSLSPVSIAEQIVKELLSSGRLEVGYPQGQRTIFQTVTAKLARENQPAPLTPTRDWVVLVTGGARGITAEIVNDLAQSGLKLVITGRAAEPVAETTDTAGIEDITVLRRVLLQRARTQGLTPTPMQIERQLQDLLRDRAIANNLQQFRQAGAQVEYVAVDVRNAEEFGAAINSIYTRYGRLDAVIHGAGIIEDKLIADKNFASLERVFDTKADSTFLLCRYLKPESLKLLVLFSSVAGRYGNRGQSDYAAANEVMNRFAWHMARSWSNTRVVAINWGPWDTTGMASEEVKRQFRERGIVPIPLSAGRHFFLEELHYGRKGETEIVAGEGPWEAYEANLNSLKGIGEQGAESKKQIRANAPYLLLPSAPQLQPNGTVTLEHTFSLATDPYLQDHRLDGKPVLPAAGALEWFGEFVQSAWPEWQVSEVCQLRVLRGLVLDTEAGKKVLFKARASSHADSESLQVAAEIVDPERNIPFYRASVILRPQWSEPPASEILPLFSGEKLQPAVAYDTYLFHGQRFQLITAIDRLNDGGIDAQVMPSRPTAWLNSQPMANWLFDPGLIDVAPQLAIIWARVQRGTTALPARFGSVKRYGQSMPNGQLRIAFRVNRFDDHSLNYDAVFIDENGYVRFHLKDIESTCNTALNRLASHL
ncbi:SDR family NAD(P)-dependent oxidoreductase [Fischerella thermalis]|uniref:SDR family NAD(P)-dependent oxidoreductase n=2 Tax=Fischerella thermalis TaxID=372787 RepID=UPI000C80D659|nr:SDR family NAD(P)-dependent oxidoreductase [Fischerella thermalis]PLZ27918.1 polyketide synthase [Fischerella thermalis WC341]PLZ28341.1 polyketide synthase [Fischerella thermalis WC559]PLZ35406.1 polyketide synthase [Fischerella thermalis WC542]PLZ36995.1 polyketide synthase [Fischerella thermalis WC558]PLZ47886.1 polyketide synthase [Fischerella thermalis WC442]